ncbi:hypothetical protein KUTeg_009076 [Tegillarca granosa]|uniref:Uncharacterized protein n=1 Tax=Tegillarca granosa TaxID=220873 RepID=A0ABQ9F7N1_TEGGR|nr:hypothetical protein KUTeg_009076 [Tegillarca granosa]
MKPTDHISRLPRKLENNLSHLKASELQVWLLFYTLPCLQDFMSDCYLNHLALFIEGIYVLLQDTITEQQLQHAKNVLNSFYQDFGILYGSNNYTLNMHNVCQHLVDYVRNLGPLWAWSCFPFEDMNGILLDSVHGTGDACLQVLWAMQAQKRLAIDTSLILDADLRAYVEENTKKVANCSVAGGLALQQYMDQSLTEKLKILLKVETIGKISKVQRVIVNNDIFFSKEYKRMEKRIGNVVLTDQDSGMAMAAIQYFIYHHETNTCVAVVKKVSIKEDLPLVILNVNYLIRVENFENNNELFVIPVDKIVEKVLYLSGNPKMLCIARLPNLYGQCC